MGALHAGHRSLMRAGAAECDVVAVTVFVNPLQFNVAEDSPLPPRPRRGRGRLAAEAGAAIVFAPPVEEMYPGWPGPGGHLGARRRRGRRPRRGVAAGALRRRGHGGGQAVPWPAGAGSTSARRTSSSWPWSVGWWPICRCRSRSWPAPPCGSPTAWPCPAATSACRPSNAAPPPGPAPALTAGLGALDAGSATRSGWRLHARRWWRHRWWTPTTPWPSTPPPGTPARSGRRDPSAGGGQVGPVRLIDNVGLVLERRPSRRWDGADGATDSRGALKRCAGA
jgi:hypothetical protein